MLRSDAFFTQKAPSFAAFIMLKTAQKAHILTTYIVKNRDFAQEKPQTLLNKYQ